MPTFLGTKWFNIIKINFLILQELIKKMNLNLTSKRLNAKKSHKKLRQIFEGVFFLDYSAYYPVFRSMFRNVVAALNEAQDITIFLKPLGAHFQVIFLRVPVRTFYVLTCSTSITLIL